MIRIFTNAGIDGIGHCRANEKEVAKILGKSLSELYDTEQNRMTTELGAGTMALWDLAGKVTKKPVYKLLGGPFRDGCPMYSHGDRLRDVGEGRQPAVQRHGREQDQAPRRHQEVGAGPETAGADELAAIFRQTGDVDHGVTDFGVAQK